MNRACVQLGDKSRRQIYCLQVPFGYEGAIKNLKKLEEATPDCTTIKKDQVKKSKA